MVKHSYLLITLLVIVHSLNYGTVLIQNEGGGQIQSKEIRFSQPFQQIPQVAIALLNGHGDIFAEIHQVNPEGFTLQMMASDEIEAEFAYLALENDENYQIECFNRVAVGNEIQIPIIIQRPTFIGVLATNTHANNFNIDLFDGNLIVDNDGQMNMCIIITNEEQPIDLVGYQNYQEQEVAEFYPFKKKNAMSLVQAQQSLEITHLDQHKSFEIWHHQSIEIVKDSQNDIYPTHRSLEVVNEDQPNQSEFKQEESLEIFKLDNQDQQQIQDQKLIAEDIHLDIIDEKPDNQIEDIEFNDESNIDSATQQLSTNTVSEQLEDIKLDLESNQENQQSETISLTDQQQQLEESQQQIEDVKQETEESLGNENSQDIKLLTDDVKIMESVNDQVQSQGNEQQVVNIEQSDQIQNVQQNQVESIQSLQSDTISNTNDKVLQQEDVTFDDLDQKVVVEQENTKQEAQIEDIKLDNTDIESINADDIPQQQDAQEIQNDQISVQPIEKLVENTSPIDDVVVHADEIRIENVKISEANLDEVTTESQNSTEQIQQEIQQNNNNNKNDQIKDQSEDISVDPDAFSEPQQKVTQINDEDLMKQQQDIDDMIKAAQDLREEVKQLKNKDRSEQYQERLDIMQKANNLEREVGDLENQNEEPMVVEDQISLDVNSAYEVQQETQIEQPKEEQQAPIIYLNDGGINPEQQLITQEIKDNNDNNNIIVEDQLQDEVDKELLSQEQQINNASSIGEEDIQIIDASIKLDEDHQEIEVYESGQVENLSDQVEQQVEEVQQIEQTQDQIEQNQGQIEQTQEQIEYEPEQEMAQEQDVAKEDGAIEIDLTTDEGESYVRKPKKSDFLREKQRLKDKLNNVIRDFKLDSVSTNSLDSVVDGDKQYSLIIDRLDVPENNEQVIVLKDEDYELNPIEPGPEQNVKQLGDYFEAVEPNIENVNFIYDDEKDQQQQSIQIEDIKLNDDNIDEETNYKIVEAKDDELEESTLESLEEQQQQQLLSTEVGISTEEQSDTQIQKQNEDQINLSFDEFQKELEDLANTIGTFKQENVETQKTSDYIIVNDNSQIYEATYDEQSNELPQEAEPQIEDNQEQFYQGIEDDQNNSIEPEQLESQDQDSQQQQEVEQAFDVPDQEQQEINQDQADINQEQLSENASQLDEQQSEDAIQQVSRYDDAEPQEQYLTIDNLVKDNKAIAGESYEQPPQYYDASENESMQQESQNEVENTLDSDYDISENLSQDSQEQQQNNYEQSSEQEQDFIVMKAEQFIPQSSDQQGQISDSQKEEDIYSETPKDENEIDIIVDVGNQQEDSLQLNEQDYDYGDNFEIQQPKKNKVEQQQQLQQPQQQEQQQQQKQEQQLQQDTISIKKHKQKIQHSISISHNPQETNNKQNDRSMEIQHEDKSLKIEHPINQEELKKNLKEQLKQELKEELKQEIKQEIQESHNRRKSPSLVIEENVSKDPERPAQKAINNFNNLLHDVVDETLKEEDKKHYQKLPVVDTKKESFYKVEPKIEQGIEDLKKSLGLKGGVEVVDNNGKKQVINVDDLKKESEKLLTRPEKDNLNDSPQYEEYLKKVTEKSQKNSDSQSNYEEQHNMRKQEILENIKRELEIKKGHFTVPSDSPQAELSPYEFERVYLDWEKNKQDIIPSMLQHSIESPNSQEIHSNQDIVLQKSTERVSRKEEVEKEVQELLYGNQKNRKQQSKQSLKDFKVEDLKYIKDDPLLDVTYSGFVQVKANLRRRQN